MESHQSARYAIIRVGDEKTIAWDRKDGQGFVMRHAAGFKFNNTEIDVL